MSAAFPAARVCDVADGAILVEYPELDEEEANQASVALAGFLVARAGEGFRDAIPGARTLFCEFDPLQIPHETLARAIERAKPEAAAAAGSVREHRIPVYYGGGGGGGEEAGADLSALAGAAGMDEAGFAALHASATYRVAFLGFAPGFAYTTGLPAALRFPRRSTPRTRVPAGALAVAGPYTGIYPNAGPGGWNLIGSAAVRLFNPRRQPPATLMPGDRVVFEALAAADFPRALVDAGAEARLEAERGAPSSGAGPERRGDEVLRVESPGLWSAPCGAPRYGAGSSGVPPGGAMDQASLRAGNRAVGNLEGAGALEITLAGPTLAASADLLAVLAGAPCDAVLGRSNVRPGVPFSMVRGERLSIGPMREGARAYLCVAGGLSDPGLFPERVASGDLLFRAAAVPAPKSVRILRLPAVSADPVVRIVLGSQAERFSPRGVSLLLESAYRVSAASDRRGVRLEGPALEASSGGAEISPEGTALGAIQVPADGQPIILGPDRPVTGGYAKIGTVISADFPLVAQARPGSTLRFRSVSLAEALDARGRMARP
ncbi:MAG: 5-oxoprolinase/urea amidolyase family protein [Acidobacteriota bacterium]|nr:5-oxoprolinase/urea amidolyase family protein [Acidobacteriota bacterium]